MYNLSEETKELFQTTTWGVEMRITPPAGSNNNTAITLTEANLVSGSLTVDRYVSTGTEFPVGTATAGELTFTIDNYTHDYDNVVFAGAKVRLRFSVRKANNQIAYLPMGFFTIDEAPRILDTISITALDEMVQLDVAVPSITFPCTVSALFHALCVGAGLSDNLIVYSDFPNYDYQVSAPENLSEMTSRQLLQNCCQIMCANAQMSREYDGYITLRQYSTATPSESVSEAERYSSDLKEPVTVTGVSVTAGETSQQYGSTGYVLEIKDNPLIQGNLSSLVFSSLYNNVTFAPFTAETVPMPWMDPMDSMTFVKGNVSHTVYITKMTQTVNANTAFEGAGESKTQKGYATIDPLTVHEQQILSNIRTRTTEQITQAEQNAIDFSQIIGNALGLYCVTDDQSGGTKYYFCNRPNLEDSSVIYTFNANGFAWTNHWDGDNTIWQQGVSVLTDSANVVSTAIFTFLQAHKITAEYIEAGAIKAGNIDISSSDTFFGGGSLHSIISDETATVRTSAQNSANTLKAQNEIIRISSDLGGIADLVSGTAGVAIGRTVNNVFYAGATFTRNKLTFYDEAVNPVAWVSGTQFHMVRATVVKSIVLGTYKAEINDNESDTNSYSGYGSIDIRW